MNKEEANSIFKREVERFRTMPYDEFVRTIKNDVYTAEHVGLSGTRYLIELKTKRKKRKRDIVRVSASLRSLDESREKSKTWNVPFLNIPICFCTMSGIFTSFTRRPEQSLKWKTRDNLCHWLSIRLRSGQAFDLLLLIFWQDNRI